MRDSMIYLTNYHSPVGSLVLGDYNGRLCLCDWQVRTNRTRVFKRVSTQLMAELTKDMTALHRFAFEQLDAYFAGTLTQFTIPIITAGTEFQKAVWLQLMNVPYGKTIAYKQLSCDILKPSAIRAVANAVGANALSLLIPCHRIVGSDGSLTGYAGGKQAKQSLLFLEDTKK